MAAYDRAMNLLRALYDWRIDDAPILDLDSQFPQGRAFVQQYRAIRREALNVARRLSRVPRFHEIMPEQASISANDGRDWRMFILKAYGVEQPQNMAACPQLAAIVRASPQVLSASFSFLGPHKHIPPHRGPIRGITRFYMMLSMPLTASNKPAAVLKVAGSEHRLHDGEYLLWDDTFEHEAWNTSDQVRIVLSLDVWRSGMPVDMRWFSAALLRLVRLGIHFRGIEQAALR